MTDTEMWIVIVLAYLGVALLMSVLNGWVNGHEGMFWVYFRIAAVLWFPAMILFVGAQFWYVELR